MPTMLRRLLWLVLLLIVLAGAALYYLSTNLNGIVAGVIERQGSAATSTAVSVTGVDIRIREASAALSGLSIANPAGFSGNAIELNGFSIELDASTLTKDPIVVESITVDGARINLQQEGAQNNLKQILDALSSGGGSETSEAQGSGPKIIIEQFTLSGASASVSAPGLDEVQEVTLPTIVIRDIGRATAGATGAQVAQQILKPVIEKALTSAAVETAKDQAAKKIGDAVGGLLKGIGRQ